MWKMQEHFSTKESIQRKGNPDAACFLHSSVLTGRQKGFPAPAAPLSGQFPPKLSVLGGIREMRVFIAM
ncbi:MAG: hypothetical protein ABL903_20560 [Methylococcales bacterium]